MCDECSCNKADTVSPELIVENFEIALKGFAGNTRALEPVLKMAIGLFGTIPPQIIGRIACVLGTPLRATEEAAHALAHDHAHSHGIFHSHH